MTCQVKTEVKCDRCGHIELIDGYIERNRRWVKIDVHTNGDWLFPHDGVCCEGEHRVQNKWLCPTCVSEFVSWMQPGKLTELTVALRQLATDLEAHRDQSKSHKTPAGKASAEALNYVLGRVQKLL